MQVGVWFEYVASKANIADFPSRGVFDMLHDLGSKPRELIVPELSGWDEGAGAWFARGRAAAMGAASHTRRHAAPPDLEPSLRRKRRRGPAGGA